MTYPCTTLSSKHKCAHFPVYCTLRNCVVCSRYILMQAVLPFARPRTLNTLFRKFHFRVRVNHFMRTTIYFLPIAVRVLWQTNKGKRVAKLPSSYKKKWRASTLRSVTWALAL